VDILRTSGGLDLTFATDVVDDRLGEEWAAKIVGDVVNSEGVGRVGVAVVKASSESS
jgi:hypothetical protein